MAIISFWLQWPQMRSIIMSRLLGQIWRICILWPQNMEVSISWMSICCVFREGELWTVQLKLLIIFFQDSVTPAIDIYSFGMCALEMAALEIQGNGDTGTIVTEENIRKTIESLDDIQQKDFIRKCLQVDPLSRPSARELLFHPVLFEVHSLKLLAAHALVNSASKL